MSDVRIKGLAELQRALDTLPAKIESNIMRGAMRAGAKVIATQAKSNIISRSGELARGISYGVKLDRRAGRVMSYVRAGGKGRDGWYAHMVEKGTKRHLISVREDLKPSRMTRRGLKTYSISTMNKMLHSGSLKIGGKFVGASVMHPGARKKPFLRPAMDSRAQAAVEAVREYIRTRLASKHGIDVPGPDDRNDE